MKTIDEKIKELNEKDKKMLGKILVDNLYDRYWCRMHKIDYVNPDFALAREKTYKEMYER